MCGRFVQQYAPDLPARFGAVAAPAAQLLLTPRFNVAPTQQIPVVVAPEDGDRALVAARWGLTPRFNVNAGRAPAPVLFNARAETVLEKATFRRLLPHGRCLVPADGFYEWEKVGNAKLPWLYRLRDGGTFAFAGLYERWLDQDGQEQSACTVLTTTPNELVLPVHNRMPVILPRELEDVWLDPVLTDPGELVSFLAPYPAGAMERLAVSKAVNNSRVDEPRLVQPVAA